MIDTQQLARRRIGFVSTRFSGTDGVSLEVSKWAEVLERLGHTCYYLAGESNRAEEVSWVAPEAHFAHPDVREIYDVSLTQRFRPEEITQLIYRLKDHLKTEIKGFVRKFKIDLLIVENALTIPMNIPLGLALTEFIAENRFPTIAHHHDFYWERQRYLVNCVDDYLSMAFPPRLPSIQHVVINSLAGRQLSLRVGASSTLVPNVMEFEKPPQPQDEYGKDLRADLGIGPDERLFLQPTRIVQRKGIEHAIELTRRLGMKARLVISHASGDELDNYERRVREYADLMQVAVAFVSDIIRQERGVVNGRKIYALDDVYQQADLVTYPSTIEGFGNAFLEAIYFCKPIVVNDYSIYDVDIKPKGFRVIEFFGYITGDTVEQTRRVLEDPDTVEELTTHNYRLGRRYYSYSVLERHLLTLIAQSFGESEE